MQNCFRIKERGTEGENERETQLLQRPSHPCARLESPEGVVSRDNRQEEKAPLLGPGRRFACSTLTLTASPVGGRYWRLSWMWKLRLRATCGTWTTLSGEVVDLHRERLCVSFRLWSHSGSPSPRRGPGSHQGSEGLVRVCPYPTVKRSAPILGFEQGVTIKTRFLDQSGEWEGLRPALLQIECACESPGILLRCSI